MSYDFKDIAAFHGVMVFCEQRQGTLMPTDFELVSEARKLADELGTEVQAPCLLTCIKEINTPRYMSVKGINEFDTKPYTVLDYNALKDDPLIEADTIGIKGSPTNVYKSFTPPQKGACVMLEGSGQETVDQLFGILTKKHIV